MMQSDTGPPREITRRFANGIVLVWLDSWPAGQLSFLDTKLCDGLIWVGRGTDIELVHELAGKYISKRRIKDYHNWWGLRCLLMNCGGTIVQRAGSNDWQCSKCNHMVIDGH